MTNTEPSNAPEFEPLDALASEWFQSSLQAALDPWCEMQLAVIEAMGRMDQSLDRIERRLYGNEGNQPRLRPEWKRGGQLPE